MQPGHDLLDPLLELELALVEPVEVGALAGALLAPLSEGRVQVERHPVAQVFREQVEPGLELASVEQVRLAV